jgi:hypothetical protein
MVGNRAKLLDSGGCGQDFSFQWHPEGPLKDFLHIQFSEFGLIVRSIIPTFIRFIFNGLEIIFAITP